MLKVRNLSLSFQGADFTSQPLFTLTILGLTWSLLRNCLALVLCKSTKSSLTPCASADALRSAIPRRHLGDLLQKAG